MNHSIGIMDIVSPFRDALPRRGIGLRFNSIRWAFSSLFPPTEYVFRPPFVLCPPSAFNVPPIRPEVYRSPNEIRVVLSGREGSALLWSHTIWAPLFNGPASYLVYPSSARHWPTTVASLMILGMMMVDARQ